MKGSAEAEAVVNATIENNPGYCDGEVFGYEVLDLWLRGVRSYHLMHCAMQYHLTEHPLCASTTSIASMRQHGWTLWKQLAGNVQSG
jgi:hypothetical protein